MYNSEWYSSLLFYSEKLQINLPLCKKLSESKFKLYIKKQLRNAFLNFWDDTRATYLQGSGKLRLVNTFTDPVLNLTFIKIF